MKAMGEAPTSKIETKIDSQRQAGSSLLIDNFKTKFNKLISIVSEYFKGSSSRSLMGLVFNNVFFIGVVPKATPIESFDGKWKVVATNDQVSASEEGSLAKKPQLKSGAP